MRFGEAAARDRGGWPRRPIVSRTTTDASSGGGPATPGTVLPPAGLKTHRGKGEFLVRVRVRGGIQEYVLDYHPFDVVGWDGYLYPWSFSIHDFEPITGRIHQPPPSHQTFQGPNFVICSFCPRHLDSDPEAVPMLTSSSTRPSIVRFSPVNTRVGLTRSSDCASSGHLELEEAG